ARGCDRAAARAGGVGGARTLGRRRGRARARARRCQAARNRGGDRLGARAVAPGSRRRERRRGTRDARLGAQEPRRPPPRAGRALRLTSVADEVERLVAFTRALRDEALAVGPGRVVDFCRAAAALPARDLYWAGRLTLVSRPDEIPVYDRVYNRVV